MRSSRGGRKLRRYPRNAISRLLSWATVLVELIGGLAVILGAFIPVVSLPMTVVLLTAIATVHLPNGFSSIRLQSVASPVHTSGSPDTRPIFCTLVDLRHLSWADLVPWRWIGYSLGEKPSSSRFLSRTARTMRHPRIAPSSRRLEPQDVSVVFVRADIKVTVGRRPHREYASLGRSVVAPDRRAFHRSSRWTRRKCLNAKAPTKRSPRQAGNLSPRYIAIPDGAIDGVK